MFSLQAFMMDISSGVKMRAFRGLFGMIRVFGSGANFEVAGDCCCSLMRFLGDAFIGIWQREDVLVLA